LPLIQADFEKNYTRSTDKKPPEWGGKALLFCAMFLKIPLVLIRFSAWESREVWTIICEKTTCKTSVFKRK